MSDDYTTKLNNLIQQINVHIANNNLNGAIKDSETLKTQLDGLRKSDIDKIETMPQKTKGANLFSAEHIECIVNHPTNYILTNTLKNTDGEKYLLKLYNHIENDQIFKGAVKLFQSNLIENKYLELMTCTMGMQYETSINLMRKVMELPNENLLDTFVNKLCAFEYPISINHLMDIFLIEPHQPEFIASELIREAYVTSMETILQREANDVDSFSKYLFDGNAYTELVNKCCDNFPGFYNLVKTAITKQSKFIEQLNTEDGDLFWYFGKYESIEGNIKFNDFAKFIYNLASSSPELSFTYEFMVFLKNTFPPKLLNHIFAKFQ